MITISFASKKLLVINSYFPTDPKVNDFDTSDLLSTLSSISDILENEDYNAAVWAGDINASFLRNTKFTSLIDEFLEEKTLVKAWDKFPIDFTHSMELENKTYTSTLDHFFWRENLSNSVSSADVLHIPENTSDHCPIFCKINVDNLPSISEVPKQKCSP